MLYDDDDDDDDDDITVYTTTYVLRCNSQLLHVPYMDQWRS